MSFCQNKSLLLPGIFIFLWCGFSNLANALTKISYLISDKNQITYCNGNNMDSDAYRKTITKLVTETIKAKSLSKEDLIKETLTRASKKAQLTKVIDANQDFIKIENETAEFAPIDGFAGVSIFLCAWKPLMEENLKRFPEIKKVEWAK
jgi:hypothetical protein